MLSEKALEQVHGGWVITLFGIAGFVGGVLGQIVAGVGAGVYKAHDSQGHYADVKEAKVVVKPVGLGKTVDFKAEQITVLNSDDVRDLRGASLSIGATASLPPKVQEIVSKKCGGMAGNFFGIITGGNIGAEATIPVVNPNGRKTDMYKITVGDSGHAIFSGDGVTSTSIELYASASVTNVNITDTNRMENACYYATKKTC
jgi:hypothetical protein